MKINKEMTFAEVLNVSPDSAKIMFEYGLHCIGCHLSPYETVDQGGKAHGLTDEQITEMVEKINKIIEK
jgi:hybrid cluster-associated redox disulfide protein